MCDCAPACTTWADTALLQVLLGGSGPKPPPKEGEIRVAGSESTIDIDLIPVARFRLSKPTISFTFDEVVVNTPIGPIVAFLNLNFKFEVPPGTKCVKVIFTRLKTGESLPMKFMIFRSGEKMCPGAIPVALVNGAFSYTFPAYIPSGSNFNFKIDALYLK
jgi:hypothetical protein